MVQGADGGMVVKVQQNKLPEFWGQKDKDSITANEFVKRVVKMMSANNWSVKIAFNNFGLALKGSANTWLDHHDDGGTSELQESSGGKCG